MDDAALLVGFDALVSDIRDRVRLCHPIITFGKREQMYVARRLDWAPDYRDGGSALTLVDADDVSSFGTLIPEVNRTPIESGLGVVTVGNEFVDAVEGFRIPLELLLLNRLADSACRIGLAESDEYGRFRARISERVAAVVDEELAKAVAGGGMSARGLSASRVLRKCSLRRTDVAIRELAMPMVNQQLDLLRRRLRRYAIELDTDEDELVALARQHVEFVNERLRAAFAVRVPLPGPAVMSQSRPYLTRRWAMESLPLEPSKSGSFGLSDESATPSNTVRGTSFLERDSKTPSVGWDDVEQISWTVTESDEVLEYVDLGGTLENETATVVFDWQEVPSVA